MGVQVNTNTQGATIGAFCPRLARSEFNRRARGQTCHRIGAQVINHLGPRLGAYLAKVAQSELRIRLGDILGQSGAA